MQDINFIHKKWTMKNFSKKTVVIIDWNQIAVEINAFFKYTGPKLASKIPNSLRPFEAFIENW